MILSRQGEADINDFTCKVSYSGKSLDIKIEFFAFSDTVMIEFLSI